MLRFLVPGLAVVALCACSNGQNGGRRQVPPDRPAWSASVSDGRARLAYGLPDSDAVALILDCLPHSGLVTVTGPLAPGASRLVLVSGQAVARIAEAAKQVDPEAGVEMVSGADPHDAALAAFARTGRLARMDRDSRPTELPASGPERTLVRAFLDRCAR